MKELKYKLSNGDLVSIVNQSDVPKEYEVYAENGQLLGTVFTDREDGTDDAELKPFAAELRQAKSMIFAGIFGMAVAPLL